MEMLYILLLAVPVGILWLRPERENLAWIFFVLSSLLCVFIFLGVEHTSILPPSNI